MNFSTAGLAIIPPALAIAVERLSPVSERSLRQSVKQDLDAYETANHQHLIDDATKLAAGAVEVAGLAPTLVASVTSGFAILYEFPKPLWPTIIYVLVYITLALLLLRLLVGQTFKQIGDQKPIVHWWGKERTLPWTGTQTVSYFIYTSNLILILFVIVSYCILGEPWNNSPPPGHPSPPGG
jgi:hypothetical protein